MNNNEEKIIKINESYKGILEKCDEVYNRLDGKLVEIYKDFSEYKDDMIFIFYRKVLNSTLKYCEKIGDYSKFDDIASEAMVKVFEYVNSTNSCSNISGKAATYVEYCAKNIYGLSDQELPITDYKESVEIADMEFEDRMVDGCIADVLNTVLNTLTERERDMIRLVFVQENTFTQVAEMYKLSRGRTAQIVARGMRKLRHPSRRKLLILDENFKKVYDHKTSSGATLSDVSRESIELGSFKSYIKRFDNPIKIESDYELDIYHKFKIHDKDTLFDALVLGRFCMLDFSEKGKPDLLLTFYRFCEISYGLSNLKHIFNDMFDECYAWNYYGISDVNIKDKIIPILFHAFLCGIEFALENGDIYYGICTYQHYAGPIINKFSNILTTTEMYNNNPYIIADFLFNALDCYRSAINTFICNYYHKDSTVRRLYASSKLDKIVFSRQTKYSMYEAKNLFTVTSNIAPVKYRRSAKLSEIIKFYFIAALKGNDEAIEKFREMLIGCKFITADRYDEFMKFVKESVKKV